MRRFLLSGLLIVVSAAATGAQVDSAARNPADRAMNAELSKIMEATRANGLPVEPIVAKINYGLLMKAPPARIIAAARATADRLEEARNALAPHPSESDITEGEKALSSHVSVKALKDIRKVAANRPVAVPLGVLSQLVVSGVDEPKAAKIVTDLIRKGASVQQIADLGNEVNSDVQLGAKPNNALDLRMNRLTAVLGVPTGAAAADLGLTAGASSPTPPGRKKP